MAQAEEVRGFGGVTLGENLGGVTDKVYVNAAPDAFYVLELQAGSFLDCGTGMVVRETNKSGQDQPALSCGVTLQETMYLPTVGKPARLIIHY